MKFVEKQTGKILSKRAIRVAYKSYLVEEHSYCDYPIRKVSIAEIDEAEDHELIDKLETGYDIWGVQSSVFDALEVDIRLFTKTADRDDLMYFCNLIDEWRNSQFLEWLYDNFDFVLTEKQKNLAAIRVIRVIGKSYDDTPGRDKCWIKLEFDDKQKGFRDELITKLCNTHYSYVCNSIEYLIDGNYIYLLDFTVEELESFLKECEFGFVLLDETSED